MEQQESALKEVRQQMRTILMNMRNNRGTRIQTIISLWMINRLIDIQKKSEQIGHALLNKTKKNIKTKGR